jgi:hypothetical protein
MILEATSTINKHMLEQKLKNPVILWNTIHPTVENAGFLANP